MTDGKVLAGRTAVITGGSRGIGRAAALSMAEAGAGVAIIYSGNETAAEDTRRAAENFSVPAKAYKCDVSDFNAVKETCDKIVEDFGRADILVNNAGIIRDGLVLRMPEEDFDAVVGVSLKGAFNMIRHLSRTLIKSPCGRIINVSSVSGLVGNPGQANYSAAKAGMIGMTKTVARELAGRGVTCNAIAPGFIKTDMTSDVSGELIDKVVPLKRMGAAEEVAALAVFLASDSAAYITGEVIRIDGGMCI